MSYPLSITCPKLWIYQTACQAKPIKFIIMLYSDHTTFFGLPIKKPSFQELLLYKMVRDTSFFWNCTCSNNHLSPHYLFTKPTLQYLLTLFSSISRSFYSCLFLHTAIPSIYTKSLFATSGIQPIQSASMAQRTRESYCEDLYYPWFPEAWTRDKSAHNDWSFIAKA